MPLATQRTKLKTAERRTKDGREWLVAPVVALVPGVLNQELVPADEVARYTPAWDDSPVTVYHPRDGSGHVSARSQEMLAQFAVGRLYNARFDDGRLKGDVWLDVNRLAEFGEAGSIILSQIEGGTGCEVSTGYFRDVEETSGFYNGRRYVAITRNIRPDHLALLPEAEGACNWADGCGVPRTNHSVGRETTSKEPSMNKQAAPAVNRNLAQRVLAVLAEAFGVSVRSTARTPDYAGVEDTSWGDVDKSLAAYVAGYNKHANADESGPIEELSSACKTWIASKTLLGESGASTADDLIFFPVVNPNTDNLNLGALRAVLSGRGAQADIPADTLESARGVAQRLLDEEGEEEEETAEEAATNADNCSTVSLIVSADSAAALSLTPGDVPPGSIVIEAPSLSLPLVKFRGTTSQADQDRFLAGELSFVARSSSVMVAGISGVGRQITGGDYDVVYFTLADPALQKFAYDLGEYLAFWAYMPDDENSAPPEVTIQGLQLIVAYIPAEAPTPNLRPAADRVVFSHIGVASGPDQIVFELAGELRPAPADPTTQTVASFTSEADLSRVFALAKDLRKAPPASQPNGEEDMNDRRQLIEALLDHQDCHCTRETLEAMSTDELIVMAADILPEGALEGETLEMPDAGLSRPQVPPQSNEEETPADEPAGEPEPTVDQNEPEPTVETNAETEGSGVANDADPAPAPETALPAEITELLQAVRDLGGVAALREAIASIQANAADERAGLIDSLIANTRCAFNAEQLAGFTTEQLRLLATSLEPTDFSAKPRPNGRTAANQTAKSVLVEIPMPSL